MLLFLTIHRLFVQAWIKRSHQRATCIGLGLYLVCAANTAHAWQVPTPASDAATEPTPAIRPAESAEVIAFRPCAFEGITPGESTVATVLEQLGQPVEETETAGERLLVYTHPPFSKVQIYVLNEKVTSLILHLETPAPARQIAKELEVESFEPARVLSETGQVLGRAFPERGVLLNFEHDSPAKVRQLILEPIRAELFVLRAKHDHQFRYAQKLADLEAALEIDPTHRDALATKVSVLMEAKQYAEALETIELALPLTPSDSGMVLSRAEALFRLERPDDARVALKSVIDDQSIEPIHRARAQCLQGDLLAAGETPDYAKAVQHHVSAVKTASPLASDAKWLVRREAKRILRASFLGAAHDIAAGNWQKKSETVNKWLESARELADASALQDPNDSAKMQVIIASLAAHAEMGSDLDPERMIASVDREADRLLGISSDELFQACVRLGQAGALLDAASIEHGRDGHIRAFDYASRAAEIVDALPQDRLADADQYLIGRLYFFVGSSHAVLHRNHEEAVRWYAKAYAYLNRQPPPSQMHDLGRHGERLVSMGASYWETGKKEEAVDLTRRGMEMMKQAARKGTIDEQRLSLPYGNLAAMYLALGKTDDAKDFTELAARLSSPNRTAKRTR